MMKVEVTYGKNKYEIGNCNVRTIQELLEKSNFVLKPEEEVEPDEPSIDICENEKFADGFIHPQLSQALENGTAHLKFDIGSSAKVWVRGFGYSFEFNCSSNVAELVKAMRKVADYLEKKVR